ncbi:outer membrane immunogenic protein [Bartonella japonica]|uniref:Outer membrane immunogenic protein n=1 Tax=Bartonella japonica TaxID=357761 RepID=A0ABV2FPH1_9HYPH
MNIKSLMTASVIALILVSATHAAGVVIPHEVTPPVINAPSFSWSGFYLGGQIGGFSSKFETVVSETKEKYSERLLPQPSGFMSGIFAGFNVGLGNGLILGVETDANWVGLEQTKPFFFLNSNSTDKHGTANTDNSQGKDIANLIEISTPVLEDNTISGSITLKEKWSGATRVRMGFAIADRIMPYVAGGVAYAQVKDSYSVNFAKEGDLGTAVKMFDDTKTFVGFTIDGGIDLSVIDNVLLRVEYRYSDFGKKAFVKGEDKFSYKTNDFRVGVAYKF